VGCALFGIIASEPVHADQVTLLPIKDNTLYEPIQQDGYADRSDGAGPTMFAGKVKDAQNQTGGIAVRRAVLEFDIAGNVPAGSTINSAQLTLYCDKVGLNTNFNVSLHRALSEWGEASNTGNSQQDAASRRRPNATWHHVLPDQFLTRGWRFSPTASVTRTVGRGPPPGIDPGMVGDIQTWLNSLAEPRMDHHRYRDAIQMTKRFGTRENATVQNRPALVVNRRR
jgi:hypothetical protein